MREVLRRHGWQIALLSVGVLVLVALILNLAQGGLWVVSGASGKNAYELAVENGFEGSLQEWLSSLAGADGQDGTNGADGGDGQNGKSAYELAVENGFRGSLQEWLLSLAFGEDGEDGKDGIDGENGKDGADGQDGADGVGIRSVYINGQGHLMVVLTDGSVIDAGAVGSLPQSEPSDFELAQQQGYTGTLHEWLCSYNDGSRETSVSDITKSSEGRLIVTLSDGSELDAGPAPADGFISQAVDAEGFRPRFEMVVMNHEASSLHLREKPNDTGSASVTIVNAGDELVCIGSAGLEGELFYRFYHAGSGRNCYARAKYFDLKYDYRTAEAGLNLPDRLVLTAGEPFRFVTGEIMPWADDSYRLEYTYSGTSHLLETEGGVGVSLTARFRDGSADASHAAEDETLTVTLWRTTPQGQLLLQTASVAVTVAPPAALPDLSGLFIGDSRIASGCLLESLQALAGKTAGLRLLGTLQNAAGLAHEARGGWKAENYWKTQQIGDVVNPFYNPETECFDFSYYMQTNYPDETPDFVVLWLGANDGFTRASVDYLKQMEASIHAYDPDIAVLVMTEYLAPAEETAYFADRYRRAQFAYFGLQEDAFAGREEQRVYLLPNLLCLDTWGDRPLREEADGSFALADTVHLGDAGYRRQAQVLRTYLGWLFCE